MNYITVIKGSEILTEKFDSYMLEGDLMTLVIKENGQVYSKDFSVNDIHAVFYEGTFRTIESFESYEIQDGFVKECCGDGSMNVKVMYGEEGKEEKILQFETNKEDLENDLRKKLQEVSEEMRGTEFYCFADVTEVTGYNLLDAEKVIVHRLT